MCAGLCKNSDYIREVDQKCLILLSSQTYFEPRVISELGDRISDNLMGRESFIKMSAVVMDDSRETDRKWRREEISNEIRVIFDKFSEGQPR